MQASSGRIGPSFTVSDYLASLGPDTLGTLYTDTYTVLTIFRSLPAMAKQYVLRMLCAPRLPERVLKSWKRRDEDAERAHKDALNRLKELKVLNKDVISGSAHFVADTNFMGSLRRALCSQLSQELEPSLKKDKKAPTMAALNTYCGDKWNLLLHFLVGAVRRDKQPHMMVQEQLQSMGLMQARGERLVITSDGFSFLFKSVHAQVWEIVIAYMRGVAVKNMDHGEVLRFLFRLSFLQLGQDYPVEKLTTTQRALLQELRHFGLIYMRRDNSSRYYPTRLALNLSSSPSSAQDEDTEQPRHLIVETNFKLYAYTTSPLQLTILALFVRFDYKLPNMICGTMTKESVRRALKANITSRELIQYLEQSAHPQMMKNTPVVPSNVCDQVRLWEEERNRIKPQTGGLLEDFASEEEYQLVLHFVKQKRLDLWCSPPEDDYKKIIVVEGALDLIKQWKLQGGLDSLRQ